jgi:endo-beta-N-acetylglucosaminidase D
MQALEVIQRAETSCALFAPAWTYEPAEPRTEFYHRDRRLWYGRSTGKRLLFNNTDYRTDPGIAQFVPERPRRCRHFYSNFNRGYGTAFYLNGNVRPLFEKKID